MPATASDSLRVAAAQYPIERLASFAALEDKIARWVADAAQERADIVVFPEYGAMEIAGTHGDEVAGDLGASLAAVADGLARIDGHHAALARMHRIHILAASGPARLPLAPSVAHPQPARSSLAPSVAHPQPARSSLAPSVAHPQPARDRYVNAARLFTPSGAMGVQHKLIMTPFEHRWGISAGDTLNVFETELGTMGILVCYDSEFPLLARAQAQAGARLILVPSCTERISGFNRVRTGARARALENGIATVQSPTIGEALWSPAVDRNAGAAGIYVPAEHGVSETGVIAQGVIDTPSLVVGDIDFRALARLKDTGEMRNVEDWSRQPGAAPLPRARVVDLR